MHSYNWTARQGDVLRQLYHGLIPKKDRKLYGEYYTPDWLAALVCREMLDEEWLDKAVTSVHLASAPVDGIGVLDPTCGSGTFLFHAAQRIRRTAKQKYPNLDESEISQIAAWLVKGVDIHPVAIEMAQATLMRALPSHHGETDLYQGDALLTNSKGSDLFQDDNSKAYLVFPPDSSNLFSIPYNLLDQPDSYRRIRSLVAAADHATGLPHMVTQGLPKAQKVTLIDAHAVLTKIIKEHGNSVWAWYIRNRLAPHAIARRKVNRIVGNPPWVRFSEIQDPVRKTEMRKMAIELKIMAGSQNATGVDIGGLFAIRTKEKYLTSDGQAAYVLNGAALKANNWKPFRDVHGKDGMLDLNETYLDGRKLKRKPFGGAQACVVGLPYSGSKRLVLKESHSRLAENTGLEEVQKQTEMINALPELPPRAQAGRYLKAVRQGATIVPGVLVRIDLKNSSYTLQPKLAKTPWNSLKPIDISGIPNRWRVEYLESGNLIAFGIQEPLSQAIIPNDGKGRLLTDAEASKESDVWQRLSNAYKQNMGKGEATPKTLADCINHNNKLEKQYPLKNSVIYNTSGSRLRAAVGCHPIESKLYRVPTESLEEAHYLCAMLNAPTLTKLYELVRKSDRHFHKTPLQYVPISDFHQDNTDHKHLAELSMALHENRNNASDLEEIGRIAKRLILNADPSLESIFGLITQGEKL